MAGDWKFGTSCHVSISAVSRRGFLTGVVLSMGLFFWVWVLHFFEILFLNFERVVEGINK